MTTRAASAEGHPGFAFLPSEAERAGALLRNPPARSARFGKAVLTRHAMAQFARFREQDAWGVGQIKKQLSDAEFAGLLTLRDNLATAGDPKGWASVGKPGQAPFVLTDGLIDTLLRSLTVDEAAFPDLIRALRCDGEFPALEAAMETALRARLAPGWGGSAVQRQQAAVGDGEDEEGEEKGMDSALTEPGIDPRAGRMALGHRAPLRGAPWKATRPAFTAVCAVARRLNLDLTAPTPRAVRDEIGDACGYSGASVANALSDLRSGRPWPESEADEPPAPPETGIAARLLTAAEVCAAVSLPPVEAGPVEDREPDPARPIPEVRDPDPDDAVRYQAVDDEVPYAPGSVASIDARAVEWEDFAALGNWRRLDVGEVMQAGDYLAWTADSYVKIELGDTWIGERVGVHLSAHRLMTEREAANRAFVMGLDLQDGKSVDVPTVGFPVAEPDEDEEWVEPDDDGHVPAVTLRADVLRGYFGRQRYNQSQFARDIGVSKGYFSMLLSGKRGIGPSLAHSMAIKVGVERYEDLFEGMTGPVRGDGQRLPAVEATETIVLPAWVRDMEAELAKGQADLAAAREAMAENDRTIEALQARVAELEREGGEAVSQHNAVARMAAEEAERRSRAEREVTQLRARIAEMEASGVIRCRECERPVHESAVQCEECIADAESARVSALTATAGRVAPALILTDEQREMALSIAASSIDGEPDRPPLSEYCDMLLLAAHLVTETLTWRKVDGSRRLTA